MTAVDRETMTEGSKTKARESVRLAAVGDVHCTKMMQGTLQPLFSQIGESANVLLFCGDLTNTGSPEEAYILARELSTSIRIPVLAVLGNHDYESGKQDEINRILSDTGVIVLDGDSHEIYGIGFAGVKGFGGGFGERALQAWGEDAVKNFVREAVDESLKLESALARLRTDQRIVLLHYSPIQSTVEGEPTDIFPFLGSSRLEEPINRYSASAVFHCHAHHGSPEGHTVTGIPVYNVAMPLLQRSFPDRPPFRLMEIRLSS